MNTQSTIQQEATSSASRPAVAAPGNPSKRVRSAAEVLGILEPRPVDPIAAVPAGYWKTGWLPKPEGAVS